jgi:6-phosphogluconolactonase
VAGEGKRAAVERLFRGDRKLPAARLRPIGRLRFFLDRAAAPEDRP